MTPRDSYHQRIYIQPLGLYLLAEAGEFDSLQIDFGSQTANVSFRALEGTLTSRHRMRVETPGSSQMHGSTVLQIIAASPSKGPCQLGGATDLSRVHAESDHAACAACKLVNAESEMVQGRTLLAKSNVVLQDNLKCCVNCPACVRGAYEFVPCNSSRGAWLQFYWDTAQEVYGAVK